MMDGRLSGSDMSLDATQSSEDEGRAWIDTIEDDSPRPEETVAEERDSATLRGWLAEAMARLDDRERYILQERKLREDTRTLESLGLEMGLSKERIRQVEAAALAKLRKTLEVNARGVHDFLR
jgi:RNA polymerase sigma-32 factor